MTERQRPRFRGIGTYRDPQGRFTFRYPSDWHEFELAGHREGVMFSPEPEDPRTYFAVWISNLDEPVVAEDLEDLKSGVEEGFSRLPGCRVESASEDLLGNLVKFERVYTFREGEAVRKRRVWLLYVDTWQMVVTFQGASPEEYRYWLPMGNYSFALFNLPEELWFATDRTLDRRIPTP
jgi:hypothetical protein